MASARPTATPAPTTTRAGPKTASRSNLGPLTTAYQPPSRCFDRTFDAASLSTLQQGGFDYAKALSMFVTNAASVHELCPSASLLRCLPHYRRYSSLKGPGLFFSPGLECPSGWQTVAAVTASNVPSGYLYVDGIVASTLLPDESAHVCCPRGFDYVVAVPPAPPVVYCSSVMKQYDRSFKYWYCSGNSSLEELTKLDAGYALTITSTSSGQVSLIPISFETIKIYAPTIQLNRRARDVRPSSTTTTEAPPPGRGSGTVQAQAWPAQEGSPRLHGGAIAGIAIGVVVALALLGAMAALVWKRRATAGRDRDGNKPELDADPGRARTELEAGERHELEAVDSRYIFELGDGQRNQDELPADANESSFRRWSGRVLPRGM
ncbi:hypothetical protein CDD83_6093 [Cordyceps sp. RAO-2017]|nr:hypothetical protein CDD83_6093 [Cordyceps sp. RAO-2017]